MKKEDYMKLSKERLAELLEERDNQQTIQPTYVPPTIIQSSPFDIPCWHKDGVCTNPFRDCINCPRTHYTDQQFYTTCTTCTAKNHLNDNLNENVE